MCMEHAKSEYALYLANENFPLAIAGSRRRRIWDLHQHTHCPVIGVCLPLNTLHKIIDKTYALQAHATDYELHVLSVSECGRRSSLSEALQRELDRRYAHVVARFKAAKTTAALSRLWQDALANGDIADALWAALTHSRCTPKLEEEICRDMHMHQHQAGASARVDLSEFQALKKQNGLLVKELESIRQRSARALTDKTEENKTLAAALMRARADCIGKDTAIASLEAQLRELTASIPSLQSRTRLTKQIAEMAERQQTLERQSTLLHQRLEQASRLAQAALAQAAAAQLGPEPECNSHSVSPAPVLEEKTVLCVGGRSGSIAIYRNLIERVGGRFSHHDGGLEDSANQLDANLAAADLVICQTGCVSHQAYWRVKDYCKRTGKRCVFVENPSASGLTRSLTEIAANTHLPASKTCA
jgi:hypothetical protein